MSLLALPVLALSQPEAKAAGFGFKICLGFSFDISCTQGDGGSCCYGTPHSYGFQPSDYGYMGGAGPGHAHAYYNSGAPSYYAYPYPYAQPQMQQPTHQRAYYNTYQPVSYYPTSYVPSYWYGR